MDACQDCESPKRYFPLMFIKQFVLQGRVSQPLRVESLLWILFLPARHCPRHSGYHQEGLPVPSLNYKTLMYNCNALHVFMSRWSTAAVLHLTHTHSVSPRSSTTTAISCRLQHLWLCVELWDVFPGPSPAGKQVRMSGNFIYDVFKGAIPQSEDWERGFKDVGAEVRIPWNITLFLCSFWCMQAI